MITAEWLFKNHASHLALVTLLNNEISYESDMESMQKNHDMDIEGLALGRLPLDGLPHTPTYNSATEQIMLKLEDSAIREQSDRQWQLLQYRRYIQMYDTIITILTPKERWFVDKYYIQKHTIASISEEKGNPFEGCVRSTIWRFKQKLLKHANEILLAIQHGKDITVLLSEVQKQIADISLTKHLQLVNYVRTHHHSYELAEDCVQEAYIEAIVSADKIHSPDKLFSWLKTVALRKAQKNLKE